MKTKVSIFLSVVIMVCSAISFVACSSDDDNESKASVVGNWSYSWEDEMITLKFHKDGNGVCNQKGDYSGPFNYNTTFTYHMDSDNTGMITFEKRVDLSGGYSEYYQVVYFVKEASNIYLYKLNEYSDKNIILTLKRN